MVGAGIPRIIGMRGACATICGSSTAGSHAGAKGCAELPDYELTERFLAEKWSRSAVY
jgi:hypothetical protein